MIKTILYEGTVVFCLPSVARYPLPLNETGTSSMRQMYNKYVRNNSQDKTTKIHKIVQLINASTQPIKRTFVISRKYDLLRVEAIYYVIIQFLWQPICKSTINH